MYLESETWYHLPGGGSTVAKGAAAASSASESELEEHEFSCIPLISFGRNDQRESSGLSGNRD